MKTCPYCAHGNMEGVFYCEECGQILVGSRADSVVATRQLLFGSTHELMGRNTWGTARFAGEASIILHVHSGDPVELKPAAETILGRADPTNSNRIGFDLTPYSAQEKGVSRTHAAI